jgi:microcystin-dependent protein
MEQYIGEIRMVGFGYAPRGWAFCNGQVLAISSNPSLFSLIGTTFGGDGRVTFALPDLRGRMPAHAGNSTGPELPPILPGQMGGAPSAKLNAAQLPPHVHNFNVPCNSTDMATSGSPANGYPAVTATRTGGTPIYAPGNDNSSMGGGVTAPAGEGAPVPTMPPYLGLNFIIALEGEFPPRE